jgi:hypothetical protein
MWRVAEKSIGMKERGIETRLQKTAQRGKKKQSRYRPGVAHRVPGS